MASSFPPSKLSTDAPAGSPAARIVKCPACGGDSLYSSANRYRPFCSERCKLIDLGAWAAEQHAIPGDATPPDEGGGIETIS